MHVEPPKSKTLKEFGGEYLMIVISILTALALEQAVETMHHRHLAHAASEKLEAELRINATEVDKVLAHNEGKLQALSSAYDQMLISMNEHVSAADFMKRFHSEWSQSVELSLQEPTLRREAWETAVANQAVTWMPDDSLERYATVYSQMRDTNALFGGGSINFLNGPQMFDVVSDIQVGEANPRDVLHMVRQLIAAYDSMDGNLKILKRELDKAATARSGKTHA